MTQPGFKSYPPEDQIHLQVNCPECGHHTTVHMPDEAKHLRYQVEELRQGIWDMLRILGFDTDGDPTPRALVSDIVAIGIRHAQEFRETYEEALED